MCYATEVPGKTKMKNIFYKIVILAILLSGCAKKDPVANIADQHSQHITDVLDYSYNNIEQTKDVIFLENELKTCQMAIVDVKQAHYSRLAACNSDVRYWRLAAFGLFILLCGSILMLIKRWF